MAATSLQLDLPHLDTISGDWQDIDHGQFSFLGEGDTSSGDGDGDLNALCDCANGGVAGIINVASTSNTLGSPMIGTSADEETGESGSGRSNPGSPAQKRRGSPVTRLNISST